MIRFIFRIHLTRAVALSLLTAALVGLAAPRPAASQDITQQLRRVYESTEPELPVLQSRPNDGHTNFQWGVWTAPALFTFNNQAGSRLVPDTIDSIKIFDQRLWGRWDFPDDKSLYLRVRYLDFNYGTESGAVAPRIYEQGFDLDVGYLDIPADEWSFRLGRQYLILGRGIVLYNRLDAAKASFADDTWSLMAFWGHTPWKTTDLDPFIGRSDRTFAGGSAGYKTDPDHRLFAYALDNGDDTSAALPGQGLAYNSQYYGFGSEGRLIDDVRYYAELIWEKGDSYANGVAAGGPTSEIDADAQYLEASYQPNRRHHPTLIAAYFRGSGDPDRGSVITSAGGNLAGTPDNAFIGVGRFDGGLALSPRLSNLIVYRLGATYNPLEIRPDYKAAQLGAYLSFYRKDEAAGAISNEFATVASDDVGVGYDLVASYRPVHDLTVAFQVGWMQPGDAFPAPGRDTITSTYASLIYNY